MDSNIRSQLESIYNEAMRSIQHRKISPTTADILRLLASKAKVAIQTDTRRVNDRAFLEDVQEITLLNDYISKRISDVQRLSELEKFAKLGDYSMVYCQKLKEAGASGFRKMKWIWILDVLEAEKGRLTDWMQAGEHGEKPEAPMIDDIDAALSRVGEEDKEHGYWVIRFYANRNRAHHSEILDLRLRGEYPKLLEVVEKDIEYFRSRLTGSQTDESHHSLQMVVDFRNTWFEQKSSGSDLTWGPNARARAHMSQLASLAKDAKDPATAYNLPDTEYEKLHKELATVMNELEEVKGIVSRGMSLAGSATKLGLAALELQAAATSEEVYPNSARKRILSQYEVYTPETKRQKIEDAFNALPPLDPLD